MDHLSPDWANKGYGSIPYMHFYKNLMQRKSVCDVK